VPRVHFITGKGGVGKSTIAAAIAILAAGRGARVLAIELGEPAGLCRTLCARPREPGAIVRASAGVHVASFDGAAALAEYLTRRMHLGRFARPLLAHPLYAAFVAAAPGLRELVAIGKVRDELVLQHRWDVVVVDAGASGHALEHLRMPAVASSAFASGRVHREAAANAELLRDPERCAIHIVATPEETPLREAAQTLRALRAYDLAIGRVIVNRCVPPAPPGVDDAIAAVRDPDVARMLRRARSWERVQEDGIAALEAELGIACVRIPKLPLVDGLAQARALAWPIAEVA
jgi:anion-transporting  ArsA/GET3 family ATPase